MLSDMAKRLSMDSSSSEACDRPNTEMVQCDGPCMKMVFYEDLVEFDDCDHKICSTCLINSPSRAHLCCNPDCLISKGVMPLVTPIRFHSATSLVDESYQIVLLVRVVYYLLDGGGNIHRNQFSLELNGNTTVREMAKVLGQTIPDIKESAVYYTVKKRFKRRHLIPLPPSSSKLKLREMCQLKGKESITVVVAGLGLTIF